MATELLQTCRKGNLKLVRKLVKSGANVDIKEKETGTTPLHYAASTHNIGLAQVLLDAGASPDLTDKEGIAPLHRAVHWTAEIAMVQLLLNKGANVDVKDQDKRTPLHYAVQDGYMELVTLLLDSGASVHERDSFGDAPLHRAIHFCSGFNEDHLHDVTIDTKLERRRLIVQTLLDANADARLRNREGKNIVQLAMAQADPNLLFLLMDHVRQVDVTYRTALQLIGLLLSSCGSEPTFRAALHHDVLFETCKFMCTTYKFSASTQGT